MMKDHFSRQEHSYKEYCLGQEKAHSKNFQLFSFPAEIGKKRQCLANLPVNVGCCLLSLKDGESSLTDTKHELQREGTYCNRIQLSLMSFFNLTFFFQIHSTVESMVMYNT